MPKTLFFMKHIFIILALLLSYSFKIKAQDSKLLITESKLIQLVSHPVNIQNHLLNMAYRKQNDSTYTMIQSNTFGQRISKITIPKNNQNISFILEENVDAVSEILKILQKNNFLAKEKSTKKFEFITSRYPMLIKLDIGDKTFRLTATNIRQNMNTLYASFPKTIESNTKIYNNIKLLSEEEAQKMLEIKKKTAKQNELLREKYYYLQMPFNLETLCTYFGSTTQHLSDNLIYKNSYNATSDNSTANLSSIYFNYLSTQNNKKYTEFCYTKKLNRNQPIYTVVDPFNKLVAIQYNILSSNSVAYLAEWERMGAKKVGANDKFEFYEYDYKKKRETNFRSEYITLTIVAEKPIANSIETTVRIFLKNIKGN